jgi:proliferating cell nuclear antigen
MKQQLASARKPKGKKTSLGDTIGKSGAAASKVPFVDQEEHEREMDEEDATVVTQPSTCPEENIDAEERPVAPSSTAQPPEKMLEIMSVKTSAIRCLLEAVKELLSQATLEFSDDGIRMTCPDCTRKVAVHLDLKQDRFEKFHCTRPIRVGCNIMHLHKIMRAAQAGDTLMLHMFEGDLYHLHIRLENSDKRMTKIYDLPTMLPDMEPLSFRETHHQSIITMPSCDFHKICRDMTTVVTSSGKVEIISVADQITFLCVGDICRMETVISVGGGEAADEKKKEKGAKDTVAAPPPKVDAGNIVQGVFSLKYMSHFAKCTNLCKTVRLYMKSDEPLVVEYLVESLGVIKMLLNPIKDEDFRVSEMTLDDAYDSVA